MFDKGIVFETLARCYKASNFVLTFVENKNSVDLRLDVGCIHNKKGMCKEVSIINTTDREKVFLSEEIVEKITDTCDKICDENLDDGKTFDTIFVYFSVTRLYIEVWLCGRTKRGYGQLIDHLLFFEH